MSALSDEDLVSYLCGLSAVEQERLRLKSPQHAAGHALARAPQLPRSSDAPDSDSAVRTQPLEIEAKMKPDGLTVTGTSVGEKRAANGYVSIDAEAEEEEGDAINVEAEEEEAEEEEGDNYEDELIYGNEDQQESESDRR